MQVDNENKSRREIFNSVANNRGGLFAALRIRNIRVDMIGQSVNLLVEWMQTTAQAWVVWELTHRATALGIVAFLSEIPFFIFGPWVSSIEFKIFAYYLSSILVNKLDIYLSLQQQ